MLLVIDNYDSFTYNLVQYLGELIPEFPHLNQIIVKRNDRITLTEIEQLRPQAIIISPGPGRPETAGITVPILQNLADRLPILGVCLGHQAIGLVWGGQIVNAPTLMHGKTSLIFHNNTGVLANLPSPFTATRYHSLVIERTSCPSILEIIGWTEDGLVMAVRHRQFPHVQGVQFHPESILTNLGKNILRNFLATTV
ncbi:MAG: anthranilate synthase component II [Pseudanabaenaceae cyanobacterium]